MNRISATTLLAIASVASCTGAIAQQPALRANIPFDFTVGNTWMPAGEYTITSPTHDVLALKSGSHIASVVSIQSGAESNSGSELVFDRYDDQYFLHQVLCPNLVSLKRARERATEAKGPVSGNQIMVAAR